MLLITRHVVRILSASIMSAAHASLLCVFASTAVTVDLSYQKQKLF